MKTNTYALPLPLASEGDTLWSHVDHGRRYVVGRINGARIVDEAQAEFAAQIAHRVNVHDDMRRALQWAAAFVGCFTGDGAGPNPPDWPRLENGDPDPEAIARECFRVLALAGAPTR